jgi:hypothetical protein
VKRRRGLCIALAGLLFLIAVGPGCGSTGKQSVQTRVHPDAAPRQPTGRITFDCQPKEALVVVDGDVLGTVSQLTEQGGATLPQGHHRIEIKHEGYRTFRFELILKESTETIQVQLQQVDRGK